MEADRQGRFELALQAAERVLDIEPAAPLALLQRARCARTLGRAELAATDCRALIASRQLVAQAWFRLADLKTVPLVAGELAQLERDAAAPLNSPADRLLL